MGHRVLVPARAAGMAMLGRLLRSARRGNASGAKNGFGHRSSERATVGALCPQTAYAVTFRFEVVLRPLPPRPGLALEFSSSFLEKASFGCAVKNIPLPGRFGYANGQYPGLRGAPKSRDDG